jgi:hypothetical protein
VEEDERVPGLEVLALLGDPRPMQALLTTLREQNIAVDIATSLADARQIFFGKGGHDCLVLAPDVVPGLAAKVMKSLRAVDPQLPTATFGPRLEGGEARSRTAMLASFHPSSRAGAGALLRFLAGLERS